MGYWEAKSGLWGDQPSDTLVDALQDVVVDFLRDVRRLPTKAEIREGLEFLLSGMALPDEEIPAEPSAPILKVIDDWGYVSTGGDLPYSGRTERQRDAGQRVRAAIEIITQPHRIQV